MLDFSPCAATSAGKGSGGAPSSCALLLSRLVCLCSRREEAGPLSLCTLRKLSGGATSLPLRGGAKFELVEARELSGAASSLSLRGGAKFELVEARELSGPASSLPLFGGTKLELDEARKLSEPASSLPLCGDATLELDEALRNGGGWFVSPVAFIASERARCAPSRWASPKNTRGFTHGRVWNKFEIELR